MWALRIFILIILIVLMLGFAVYNAGEKITVNLYARVYEEVPMIVMSFWALVLGMFISFILGIGYYLKLSSELNEQKSENKRLTEEIKALRNLPLEEFKEEENQ